MQSTCQICCLNVPQKIWDRFCILAIAGSYIVCRNGLWSPDWIYFWFLDFLNSWRDAPSHQSREMRVTTILYFDTKWHVNFTHDLGLLWTLLEDANRVSTNLVAGVGQWILPRDTNNGKDACSENSCSKISKGVQGNVITGLAYIDWLVDCNTLLILCKKKHSKSKWMKNKKSQTKIQTYL